MATEVFVASRSPGAVAAEMGPGAMLAKAAAAAKSTNETDVRIEARGRRSVPIVPVSHTEPDARVQRKVSVGVAEPEVAKSEPPGCTEFP
jgi:hypothetical protein